LLENDEGINILQRVWSVPKFEYRWASKGLRRGTTSDNLPYRQVLSCLVGLDDVRSVA
jgi:hypothetical protein